MTRSHLLLVMIVGALAQCNTNTLFYTSCGLDCKSASSVSDIIIPATQQRSIDAPPKDQNLMYSFQLQGVTGRLSTPAMSRIFLDASAVGMGFQFRVSYDYDGDSQYDQRWTSPLITPDALFGQYETFTSTIGGATRDINNGNILVEFWSTFASRGTGRLRIGPNMSNIVLPFTGVSSASCSNASPTPSPSPQPTTAASSTSATPTPSSSPSSDICKTMFESLRCRATSDNPSSIDAGRVSGARTWLCGNHATFCSDIINGGKFSNCNSVQQLSQAMNRYYETYGARQGAAACDFGGVGTVVSITNAPTPTSATPTPTSQVIQTTVPAPNPNPVPAPDTVPAPNPNPVPIPRPPPTQTPTPTPNTNARWSTLYNGRLTDVTIPSGQRVLLDVNSVEISGVITIQKGGALVLDYNQPSITVTAAAIVVQGEFHIGSESNPFNRPVGIVLSGTREITVDGVPVGSKVIVVGNGGVVEWHGIKGLGRSWTQLSQTAQAGANRLQLAENFAETSSPSSWTVGDELVVAGTDYAPDQAEVVTITRVLSGNTVEISPSLKFYHHGTVTMGIDERAQVGILSRTITISSGNAGRRGAHTLFLAGSLVHIEGVEGVNLGQDQIARYPFHWHMAGETQGHYIRHSSVRSSIFRCVTIHGSHGITVSDVVTHDNAGHCMYLEDGVERNNVFRHNLITSIKEKKDGERMGSDYGMAVSGFWITAPDNVFEDNVVSGSPGAGYWVHARHGPRGLSSRDPQYRNYRPSGTNLKSFKGNFGIGCDHGFQIEATYYDNYNVPLNDVPESPMSAYAPQSGGKDMAIYLDDFTAHHNRFRGLWARAPVVYVRRGKFSNNMEGIQLATSGDHPSPGSVGYVDDSLIVGWTDNVGNNVFNQWQMWNTERKRSWPRNGIPMVGVALYDGPQVVRRTTFDSWEISPNETPHSAIGTRFHGEFQIASSGAVVDCQFKRTTRRVYVSDRNGDGGKSFNFRLGDGTVLPQWPFYQAPGCNSDASLGLLCPQRYAQMWLIDFENRGGNKMHITRNEHAGTDHRNYELQYQGFHSAGIWRYQPLLSIGAHYLVEFSGRVSGSLALQLNNAEQGESISVAICYPRGTTFRRVSRGLSNRLGGGLLPPINDGSNSNLPALGNRQAVEGGEGYFFDNSRGLLFISVKQRRQRSDYNNFCPNEGCDFIHVEANVPAGGAAECTAAAYSGDSIQVTGGNWLNMKF